MSKEELIAKINAIAPLIITLLAGINAFLALRGLPSLEIGDQTITVVISGIATIAGECWSWWRNNNWTKKSQTTQPVLNLLKKDEITTEQVDNFVQEAPVENLG